MRRIRVWYVYAIILMALIGFAVAGGLGIRRGGLILGRCELDGMAVGGWTQTRLERTLAALVSQYLAKPIDLFHAGRHWRLLPRRLGLGIDCRSAVAAALANGREGWLGARLPVLIGLDRRPRRISLRVTADPAALVRALAGEVAGAVERTPRNAFFNPGSGRIEPGNDGWQIDYAGTLANLRGAVLSRGTRQARLVLRRLKPKTDLPALAGLHLRHVLASYATPLTGSSPDRVANITLCAAVINGALIRPGGTFSFNAVTGPRDLAHGYRPAPEIVKQRLVTGVGGGVCQVSSTLYNAVLLSGLPVTGRTAHALPPGYVPLGRDATVYYPVLDFRFANNTAGSLEILATVTGDLLRVTLAAECPPRERISLVSQILAKIDPPLVEPDDPRATANKAGAPGYRVRLLKLHGDPEHPSKVEVVSEDLYHPVPRVKTAATSDLGEEKMEADTAEAETPAPEEEPEAAETVADEGIKRFVEMP